MWLAEPLRVPTSASVAATWQARPGAACAGSKSLNEAMRPPRTCIERCSVLAATDHARGCFRWAGAGAQSRDPRGSRRRLLASLHGARCVARGCRPPQCARQAGRRAGAQRCFHAIGGIVVLTSRVSIEMVQKAAVIGAPVDCRDVGADRACGAHRRSRRHHPGRHRAR